MVEQRGVNLGLMHVRYLVESQQIMLHNKRFLLISRPERHTQSAQNVQCPGGGFQCVVTI